ncbi:transcription termination factor NusA [Patescibacteria group bacterium]|nr:transcription termination factor NusA [Patescibacteria group bacterium]MBU1868648.1 transcription termination factor NusA [Patescibacteria group bacterium]
MRSEFMAAVNQVCSERGIDPDSVFETLKHAIRAAYRKDYSGAEEDIEIQIDKENGAVTVVQEGQDITPPGFGRIAAQTAKQVILQGVREAEKEAIIDEFQARIGTVISGMLQRREGSDWVVDLGRTTGLLPRSGQVPTENYRHNQRLRLYVKEINQQSSRYQIITSRSASELLTGLLEQEIPEVASKAIEIKAVAREPGHRSKIAVTSIQEGVDAVGSCVGQRGVRIQAITDELNGERIDVILWNSEPEKFVSAALSPAEVSHIEINEKEGSALIKVPDDQVSLAIGKEGQNARLAAKLTGYRIDIHSIAQTAPGVKLAAEQATTIPPALAGKLERSGLTLAQATKMSEEDLLAMKGIGSQTIKALKDYRAANES